MPGSPILRVSDVLATQCINYAPLKCISNIKVVMLTDDREMFGNVKNIPADQFSSVKCTR